MADGSCTVESEHGGSLLLDVHALSGKSATLSTCSSVSPQEARIAIEELLGVPAASQQWLLDTTEVSLQSALTMADTGLKSGDQITVIHDAFTPLRQLPDTFALGLTSIRQKIRTGYSSAFSILYKFKASISENWLYFEPWRKNDHDKILFDMQTDTHVTESSHWMAGTHRNSAPLNGENPLEGFCRAWCLPHRRIRQDAERFWLIPDSPHRKSSDGLPHRGQDQTRPDYNAVPGWFTPPSEDLNEIELDVPLPVGSETRRIIRLLIDQNGQPVSAAVKGCRMGHLHQDIEEYEISLEAQETLSKPSWDDGKDS